MYVQHAWNVGPAVEQHVHRVAHERQAVGDGLRQTAPRRRPSRCRPTQPSTASLYADRNSYQSWHAGFDAGLAHGLDLQARPARASRGRSRAAAAAGTPCRGRRRAPSSARRCRGRRGTAAYAGSVRTRPSARLAHDPDGLVEDPLAATRPRVADVARVDEDVAAGAQCPQPRRDGVGEVGIEVDRRSSRR